MGQKKKDFTGAAAAAFGQGGDLVSRIIAPQPSAKPAEPEKTADEMTAAEIAARFLPNKHYLYNSRDGKELRVTFNMSVEHCKKLRAICYAEDMKQKHVIEAALQLFFDTYEKQHGKLL